VTRHGLHPRPSDRGARQYEEQDLEREAERLGQRIDCLSRNRDALLRYLAVRGSLEDGAGEQGDLVR
jgi:hypothetical protein